MSVTMAKKKPTGDDTSSSPKPDQHRSQNMVRLADDVFLAMKQLAEDNDRPLTREIRQALIAWLKAKKRWPEMEAEE